MQDSRIIPNILKLKKVQMFISWLTVKQIVAHPYNGNLAINRKKKKKKKKENELLYSILCYTKWFWILNESQKHRASWKKSDTKDYVLCDSIYMKF